MASPLPVEIINAESIKKLAGEGKIVIAVGGGGIPVYRAGSDKLEGIDAVIDKDLALSLLALRIGADEFFILTDVPKVCLNFNMPQEVSLDEITVSEAKEYLKEGHFAEGSMAPKIQSAIQFIEGGGEKAIITQLSRLSSDNFGTKITPD